MRELIWDIAVPCDETLFFFFRALKASLQSVRTSHTTLLFILDGASSFKDATNIFSNLFRPSIIFPKEKGTRYETI